MSEYYEPPQEERTLAMACHLLGFCAFTAVPFANIIAPLILWQVKKDTMPLVADQGKEVVNFQIAVMVYFLVSAVLCFVLVGFVLLPAVSIYWIVCMIIGALKANEGIAYRYPLIFRLIA